MKIFLTTAVMASLGIPLALATEYHVAAGACTHGTTLGSDSNDGKSRASAFATVQKCLNVLAAGDTCWIHSGTYTGDFETPAPLSASKSSPTRILGASGDTAILQGTSNQTAYSTSTYYSANIATLSLRATGSSSATKWVEVGNLTIRAGNSAALALTRADGVYVHDIVMDNQSLYAMGALESNALVDGFGVSDFFFERIKVSNGGSIKTLNVFSLAYGEAGRIRMLDLADFSGGVETGHINKNVDFEFVKVRNAQVWGNDDGAVRDNYNSQYGINRYWSYVKVPGGAAPNWGWFNARSTEAPTRSSYYVSNMTLEDSGGGANNYGAWHSASVGTGGTQVNDLRVYNSLARNFPNGIFLSADAVTGTDCLRHEVGWLAFETIAYMPVNNTRISTECQANWTSGPGSFTTTNSKLSDHMPQTGSPLIDAGSDRTYGGTPLFPPPLGGGSRIDIGAYEAGAGSWPYEFQVAHTVTKLTARICWDSSVTGCDFVIPLWDPWALQSSSRVSAPSYYWVEIDPSNTFKSGNSTTAKGFGAFYATGAVSSSSRYHDVPAGVLQSGKDYYVQVRVGEATSATTGSGPGPWSLGFYRFHVDTGSQSQPPSDVQGLGRTDVK